MSIKDNHDLMKDSLLESKDIINQIFMGMNAPLSWQINHMTFDELTAALYKISALQGVKDEATVTPETMLDGVTAYDHNGFMVTGDIPSVDSQVFVPRMEDQVIIEPGKYVAGQQIVSGDPYLTPENIKKGVTIFGVEGELEESSGSVIPPEPTVLDPSTATSEDIARDKFAYDNKSKKIIGTVSDKRDKSTEGTVSKEQNESLYISPKQNSIVNENSEFSVPFHEIANVLNIDPSKIDSGYSILGVEGTREISNEDTNGDGQPDINIPVNKKDADWIKQETVLDQNKNNPIFLNHDTKNDKIADNNIDTNHDGKPDLNIDTDNDYVPDVNIDTDGDGIADLNIDTNGDYIADINIDQNRDGEADLNIDTDNDGIPDINIDKNRDGVADLNIDTDGDGVANLNIDTNNDGKPDLNIDVNGDGIADFNVDTNNDGIADFNLLNQDTDGDGRPDLNVDQDGDGYPDLNIDMDGDGIADLNIDTNGDWIPDTNIDTDGDWIADTNLDTDNDGIADQNIDSEWSDIDDDYEDDTDIFDLNKDTDDDGEADLNIDDNDDGVPNRNIDDDRDGNADWNIDEDKDGIPEKNLLNQDKDDDGIADLNIDKDNDGRPEWNIDTNDDGIADINIIDQDGKVHNLDTDGDNIPDMSDEDANRIQDELNKNIKYICISQGYGEIPGSLKFSAIYNEFDDIDPKSRALFSHNDPTIPLGQVYSGYYGFRVQKRESTINVQYSGRQTTQQAAEENTASTGSFDLNDSRLNNAFSDGLYFGVYVTSIASSRFKVLGETTVSDVEDPEDPKDNGKEFGEHVSGIDGDGTDIPFHKAEDAENLDPNHESGAYINEGRIFYRFRCPIEDVHDDTSPTKIDLNMVRKFITMCDIAGKTEFTIFTADWGCVCTDQRAYKTKRTFSIDQVEECIDYLKGIADVLDKGTTTSFAKPKDHALLKLKGSFAHGPKKMAEDSRKAGCTWAPSGTVTWKCVADAIVQEHGEKQLNYYVTNKIDFNKDWDFNVVIYKVKAITKTPKGYCVGVPGIIISNVAVNNQSLDGQDTPYTGELNKNNLNIDTNNDGKPDLNIDTNNDGRPDLNIDTNGDGIADLNIDTNGDGKADLNIDTNGDGKADLNIDTDGDGIADLNEDRNKDGKAEWNIDTNNDGKADKNIDKNRNNILDEKEKGGTTDPFEDEDYPNTPQEKDENMTVKHENINDLKDDIIEDDIQNESVVNDPQNTENTDENYMFDDNHKGETNDEDHHSQLEIQDQTGHTRYVPNPVLQWEYSDYNLPADYPTVTIPLKERYAQPVITTETVTTAKEGELKSISSKYSRDHYSWTEARDFLAESGQRLVMIKDDQDQMFVENYLRENRSDNTGFWIGGTKGPNGTDTWHWIDGTFMGYTNWAPGEPNNIEGNEHYLEIYNTPDSYKCAWNDEDNYKKLGFLGERADGSDRNKRYTTETIVTGQTDEVSNQEIQATMIPFVHYATAQETRSKLYHYGAKDYLDLTSLANNLNAEMPKLKQLATQAANTNELAIETACADYMQQWPVSSETSSVAYVSYNGNTYERPDEDIFLKDHYLESAHDLYLRLGKVFEQNGEGNSLRYKDGDDIIVHSPKVSIGGESFLQVYVGDLEMTEDQCANIWGCAHDDFADYLPKWQTPLMTTKTITVTHNNTEIEKEVVENMYLGYFPENVRQQCMQEIEDTFQDLARYVKQYTGIDYSRQTGDNIYDRGKNYTYEQKKKIAKVIHDYLIVHNTYGPSAMDQSLYPAMSRGRMNPVCTSYALAFKFCCNRYGIMCHMVAGKCNGPNVDKYGGLHAWNRVCYLPNNVTEPQWLKSDGKITNDQVSCEATVRRVIGQYDASHINNYTSGSDKLYFADVNYENNQVSTNLMESHSQFDKNEWTDVDVTWDDPNDPNNENAISWEFFNVDSTRMKRQDGGNRTYAKYLMTETYVETYANLLGQDSHQDQYVSAKNDRYMGSELYNW